MCRVASQVSNFLPARIGQRGATAGTVIRADGRFAASLDARYAFGMVQTAAQVAQGGLLHVAQNVVEPTAGLIEADAAFRLANPTPSPTAGRKMGLRRFGGEHGQTHLLEMILALHPTSCFAGGLDGGKQECNENADDGDHHQQFNKRKRSASDASHSRLCL